MPHGHSGHVRACLVYSAQCIVRLRQLAGKKFSEDIVVPVAAVPAVIQELEQLTHACGIQVLGYGHLGDGNIHVNILKMSASDADWDAYASMSLR